MRAFPGRALLPACLGLLLGAAALLFLARRGGQAGGLLPPEEAWRELTDEELAA